jgi:DNA excision repair protein ERCC-5
LQVYLAEDADRELGLPRENLVSLAFLLGSDYTEGVNGVGIVNAMEILHAFRDYKTPQELAPQSVSRPGSASDPLDRLRGFSKWLSTFDVHEALQGPANKARAQAGARRVADAFDDNEDVIAFHKKHFASKHRWALVEGFPDVHVFDAYTKPAVDSNDSPFVFGAPTLSVAAQYVRATLGWTDEEIVRTLKPALEGWAARGTQQRVDRYYTSYHDNARFAKIKSKRLRDAVSKSTGKRTKLALDLGEAGAGAHVEIAGAQESAHDSKQKEDEVQDDTKKRRVR